LIRNHDVSNARLLLIILICGCPALLFVPGTLTLGVIAGVTAIGLAMVAWTLRPGEAAFFLSVAWPAAVVVLIPALWILCQELPIRALSHPIWTSVEATVGHPLTGSISIDTGATMIALGQYLTIAAIGLWAGAVAVDRQRAEWVLFSLMAGTILVAVLIAGNGIFGFAGLLAEPSSSARMQAIDSVAMGTIIAAAAGVRTWERYETRRTNAERSIALLIATFAACVVAFLGCVAVLALIGHASELIATAYGLATFTSVVLIRRFGLGRWGVAAIGLPAVILAVFLAANNPELRTKSFTLAFAAEPSTSIAMSQRILDDAPLGGLGAGTFPAIAPIYRDIDEREPAVTAPTAAAGVAIELGLPVLWLIVVVSIGAGVLLFRAALQRGRDSFYPAAGTSCLVTLLFLCFINAGLLAVAPAIIAAATFGLALAQSKSRTLQQS
jgi:hypothetical protein